MVIDARHRWWLVGTALAAGAAVALYVGLARAQPDGLPGGSRVGLLYGIAGGALIVFAWLLAALRFVPGWWWIGSRAFWLKGHLYLGTLSLVLVLCHSGGRFGGPFERVLYAVFGLTVLTGFAGLGLQQFVPRLLTARVASEVPYDQIPGVCARIRDRADQLVTAANPLPLPPAAAVQWDQWYEEMLRPFLGWPARGRILRDPVRAAEVFAQVRALPGLATPGRDSPAEKTLARLEGLCAERRQLADQERLVHLLHGWLYLHVPLAGALLVLLAAHVVLTLYY